MNNKRPDLTYLTQAETIKVGSIKKDITAIQFISKGKITGKVACDNSLIKAIENIPSLIQIAEMYFDSMDSTKEGSLPYKITKELLELLKQ